MSNAFLNNLGDGEDVVITSYFLTYKVKIKQEFS